MILHVDMDAFYASVEQMDDPGLKGKCVIVGGQSGRGVVSAASYEARRKGVHSAMPVFKARKLCADGIYLAPRMERYKAVSKQIMGILLEYTPRVEVVSIDEAFLDITGCERLKGSVEAIAKDIKRVIRERIGLTCSVGAAPNKMLAKVASDMDKPDGLIVISNEMAPRVIETLPVAKVPGVGPMRAKQLATMGIYRLGDVNRWPEQRLCRRLGSFGRRLRQLAACTDCSEVSLDDSPKSISSEETFKKDTEDLEELKKYLLAQAEAVSSEMRHKGVKARTVVLKIKHADFKQVTRSRTLSQPSDVAEGLYREAVRLLTEYGRKGKVRLIGLGAAGLVASETPRQMNLFATPPEEGKDWGRVDQALDRIREKFGKRAIHRGSLSRSGDDKNTKE